MWDTGSGVRQRSVVRRADNSAEESSHHLDACEARCKKKNKTKKQEVLFSRHLKEKKKTKKLQSVFLHSTFAFPPLKGECSNYEPCKGQNLGASRLSGTQKHPHWSCKLPQNKKNISYFLGVSRSRAKSLRQNILQQFQIDLSKLHWIFFFIFSPHRHRDTAGWHPFVFVVLHLRSCSNESCLYKWILSAVYFSIHNSQTHTHTGTRRVSWNDMELRWWYLVVRTQFFHFISSSPFKVPNCEKFPWLMFQNKIKEWDQDC